jgi:tetratricopeptide (TPR) repeat protein
MEKKIPLTEDILNLLAWSGDDFMGTSLIAALLDKKEDDLQQALKEGDSSLLQKSPDSERYRIDPKARKERQEQFPLTNKDNRDWVNTTCQHLGDWLDARRKDDETFPEFDAESLHLDQWAEHVKDDSSYHTVRLTWLRAYPPYRRGKYQDALKLVQSASSMLEKMPEPDPKLQVEFFVDLGAIYGELNNHEESLEYYKKGLESRIKLSGEEHEDTADAMSNVGGAYDKLGNQEEGVKYLEQALEVRKKLFGEEHAETATSYNNIGTTYFESGKYREAIDYLEKALDIRTRVLGEEDTDTSDSLYNLAVCWINLKKYKDAYSRLSAYLKKIPGDHPQYAELAGLIRYIDKESIKSGFRAPSAVSAGKGKKKKKKKKKKR